ncbi:hypothetical protein [Ignavibacterium sp.]|uniref:hypothetical protein n=1 Tax=Ignavibacterium sp. TaxID=2651167 RepID=UPI00307CEB47
MKLHYFSKIKVYDRYFDSHSEDRLIWRVLSENKIEKDLIDFFLRFLNFNSKVIKDGLITIIDSEMIFYASFLKRILADNENLAEIFLSYIEEKGGIFLIDPVIITIEKLSDLLKKPSKDCGIILSQKNSFQYFKEKI